MKEKEKQPITNGCIWVWEQNTDFLMWAEIQLPDLKNQDNIIFQYNQGSSLDCTLYAPIGAISDLFNYKFTAKEIKEIVDMSYTRWRRIGWGRYTQSWVRCTCDRWNNKFPDKKVIFFRIELTSQNFIDATNKWYTVVVSYDGNSEYMIDYSKDLILNWTRFYPSTYWHCTSMRNIDGKIKVKDSYVWRTWNYVPTNIYEIADLRWLVRDRTYSPYAYLIVPEERVPLTPEEIARLTAFRVAINQNIENNSNMRHLTNDQSFKDELHRQNELLRKKLEDIEKEFLK